jgi:alpha-glucan, water dikinase
MLLEYKQDDA